ncbi:hypothetical protein ACFYV5_02015 [Streptomyces sp. NPDC003035]
MNLKNVKSMAARAAVAAAAVFGANMIVAPAADAVTPTQCRWSNPARYEKTAGGTSHRVSYCPLWRSHVPVYALSTADTNNSIIGYLEVGGYANWFVCQIPGDHHWVGNYSNNMWAYTMADNGKWGFVSQVEFSGGGYGVPSANLSNC